MNRLPIPERHCQDIDIIEDVIPIHQLQVTVKTPRRVRQVMLVPEQAALPYEIKEGRVAFVVPKVNGHQMVALTM